MDEIHLRQIAARANTLYRGPILIRKKDKVRSTFDADPPLKKIHDLILQRLLNRVDYPSFLMGGIKDPQKQRGYVRNAEQHSRASLLVGEDVADYYPSITAGRVKNIFLHVFCFAPPVAAILTALCTRKGSLPQGARTSTAIANLALYKVEPDTQSRLHARGIHYTRFVDDVHSSVRRRLSRMDRTQLVWAMRGMLLRAGFVPKRKKQFVVSTASRMTVHNLNVNTGASRDRVSRKRLRMEIFLLQKRTEARAFGPDYERALSRLGSQIGSLRQTNPAPAASLQREFVALKKLRKASAARVDNVVRGRPGIPSLKRPEASST